MGQYGNWEGREDGWLRGWGRCEMRVAGCGTQQREKAPPKGGTPYGDGALGDRALPKMKMDDGEWRIA